VRREYYPEGRSVESLRKKFPKRVTFSGFSVFGRF
jgi:hypothetical protein